MDMETHFVVQSYSKGQRLVADTPFIAKDITHAKGTAEFMACPDMLVVFVLALTAYAIFTIPQEKAKLEKLVDVI